jgi:hypothetical protein
MENSYSVGIAGCKLEKERERERKDSLGLGQCSVSQVPEFQVIDRGSQRSRNLRCIKLQRCTYFETVFSLINRRVKIEMLYLSRNGETGIDQRRWNIEEDWLLYTRTRYSRYKRPSLSRSSQSP